MSSDDVLSDNLVNGTVRKLLLDISGAFNAFRMDNNARLSALESLAARSIAVDEATSSEPPVARFTSVAPIVAPILTTAPIRK